MGLQDCGPWPPELAVRPQGGLDRPRGLSSTLFLVHVVWRVDAPHHLPECSVMCNYSPAQAQAQALNRKVIVSARPSNAAGSPPPRYRTFARPYVKWFILRTAGLGRQ